MVREARARPRRNARLIVNSLRARIRHRFTTTGRGAAAARGAGHFQLVLRRFSACCPPGPLALFSTICADRRGDARLPGVGEPAIAPLRVLRADRDNEVDASHPLAGTLEAIRKGGARLQEIVLAPLGRDDVARLLGDALHCDVERVRTLAALVHDKTGGNPFFAIQFVGALSEESLLVFDREAGVWGWDLDRIRAPSASTDNVVDLMAGKLSRLSAYGAGGAAGSRLPGSAAESPRCDGARLIRGRDPTRPGTRCRPGSCCGSRACTRSRTTACRRRRTLIPEAQRAPSASAHRQDRAARPPADAR